MLKPCMLSNTFTVCHGEIPIKLIKKNEKKNYGRLVVREEIWQSSMIPVHTFMLNRFCTSRGRKFLGFSWVQNRPS